MKKFLVFSMLMNLMMAGAMAQESERSAGQTQAYFSERGRGGTQTGWAGYLGANAGYTSYNKNIDVEGTPTSLKLLGSYILPNEKGIFDFGYGIQNQVFSQDAAMDSGITTGAMELAARYQFENRWQLGAVYNQFFDKGKNYGANQADAEFAGLQVMKEFGLGDRYIGRAGARLMGGLNVGSETVNMAAIDFQIGWGGASGPRKTAAVDEE